jgi:hypothetical protein
MGQPIYAEQLLKDYDMDLPESFWYETPMFTTWEHNPDLKKLDWQVASLFFLSLNYCTYRLTLTFYLQLIR